MLKRYHQTVGDLLRVVDTSVVLAAWLAAYWVRFYASPFEVTKGQPDFGTYAAMCPLIAVLWLASFAWSRVYGSGRLTSLVEELKTVLRAHGVALLLFIAVTYAFEDYKYSRLVMMYFAVLAGLGIVVFRLLLRVTLRHLRAKGRNLRYVLAIGEGPTLEAIVRRFDTFPELGLRVIGVITSDRTLERVADKPVLGELHQVREILARVRADEVLICPRPGRQHDLYPVLELLRDETVDVRLVPDVLPYVALGCDIESFDGMPVVHLNHSPLVGSAAWVKRALDVVLASLALVIFAPLMVVIAVLIKLTSKGPILYAQERMGLDGRTFQMLKFRSMRVDAEEVGGARWATASDERRTPIGAILRKTSLDELPQLWNVLRGDMSLVGPRPERPVFVNQFRASIPHYMLRHKVKSGITGWAQVNGWRGDTSLARRIECDLFYIRNWSLALDLKILTMTLWKGFIHKNAY